MRSRPPARAADPPPPDEPSTGSGRRSDVARALHGTCGVVLPDVGDRIAAGHPVQYGEAGQRGAGPPVPAGTGDLDALGRGTRPCLAQGIPGSSAVGRQPEVRPAQPASLPVDAGRFVAQQIQREVGHRPRRKGAAESPAANEPARGQSQHARHRGLPGTGHGASVALVPCRTMIVGSCPETGR